MRTSTRFSSRNRRELTGKTLRKACQCGAFLFCSLVYLCMAAPLAKHCRKIRRTASSSSSRTSTTATRTRRTATSRTVRPSLRPSSCLRTQRPPLPPTAFRVSTAAIACTLPVAIRTRSLRPLTTAPAIPASGSEGRRRRRSTRAPTIGLGWRRVRSTIAAAAVSMFSPATLRRSQRRLTR